MWISAALAVFTMRSPCVYVRFGLATDFCLDKRRSWVVVPQALSQTSPKLALASPRHRQIPPAKRGSRRSSATMRRSFPARAASVGRARRFVTDVLGEEHPDRDTVCLLVSELATNAVVHGLSPFVVTVSTQLGQVYADVTDRATNPPRPMVDVAHEVERGRGLKIVAALSESWGWREAPTGKVVWFVMPRLPPAA